MKDPTSRSLRQFFDRSAAPLLVAGATVLAGCTTISKTELDLDRCLYSKSFSAVVGIPNKTVEKKDGDGNTANVVINGLNFKVSKGEISSAGQACETSKGIVRAGVFKDEKGDYDLTRLALLHVVYNRKDIDPTLRYMIAERTKLDHGFAPDDIPAISKAQWERNNPPAPETFKCNQETGIRRCVSIIPVDPSAGTSPSPQ
jgi:hypothetical protein